MKLLLLVKDFFWERIARIWDFCPECRQRWTGESRTEKNHIRF